MNRKVGIYKYVYNDKVIYIGKSDDSIDNRIKMHSKEDKFQPYLKDCKIYYFITSNPAETKIYETYLIDKYKPSLNVIDKYINGACAFNIPEPNWILYEEKNFRQEAKHFKHKTYKKNFSRVDLELKSLYEKMGIITISDKSTKDLIELSNKKKEKFFIVSNKDILWSEKLLYPHEREICLFIKDKNTKFYKSFRLYNKVLLKENKTKLEFYYDPYSVILFYRFQEKYQGTSTICITI